MNTKIALILSLATAPVAMAATGTVSFQNGVDGYTGTVDRRVSSTANRQWSGKTNQYYFIDGFAADDLATAANEASPDEQALIRFDNIFGNALNQVPAGAFIYSAKLTLTTPTNAGVANSDAPSPFGVAKLNQSFVDGGTNASGTTYLDYGANGPSVANGTLSRPVDTFFDRTSKNIPAGSVQSAEVAPIVQAWASGETNRGFDVSTGSPASTTNGWAVRSTSWTTVTERPKLTISYTTDPVTTLHFQQGVNGYTAGSMAYIKQNQDYDAISQNGNTVTQAYLDGYIADNVNTAANESSPDDQAIVKFDNLFGSTAGQIPAGATILQAKLVLRTTTGGNSLTEGEYAIRQMLANWDNNLDDSSLPSYYTEFGSGGGLTEADGTVGPIVGKGGATIQGSDSYIDVTSLLAAWQAGAVNNGFSIQGFDTGDGWQIFFNGATELGLRPELIVSYSTAVPEPTALGLLALGGLGLLRRARRM